MCKDSPETLLHIFCECPKVIQVWRNVERWIYLETNIKLNFNAAEILLGYLKVEYYVPVNAIILQTKKYIFSTSRKCENLSFLNLQAKLRTMYQDQNFLAQVNFKEERFQKKWATFDTLFAH